MTIFLPTSYISLVPFQMVHNGNESTCRLLAILGSLTSLSTACKSWWNHSFLVVMNQPVGCRPSSGHSRLRSFSGDCFITPTKAATWHSSLPPPPSFWFVQFNPGFKFGLNSEYWSRRFLKLQCFGKFWDLTMILWAFDPLGSSKHKIAQSSLKTVFQPHFAEAHFYCCGESGQSLVVS